MRIAIQFILLLLSSSLIAQESKRLEYAHPQMNTTFRVVVISHDTLAAQQAVEDGFRWVDSLATQLTDHLPTSDLGLIMRRKGSKTLLPVSPEVMRLLTQSQYIAEASQGAFDPTIGPLSHVWRDAFERDELPDFDQVAEARLRVDFQSLVLVPDSQGIKLLLNDMQLDLDGIARGYATEKLVEKLINAGFPHVLVDAGDEIALGYPPPGKPGWRVFPLWPDEELEPVYLSNTAIATAGEFYQFLEWEGQRYSQIIDPRTGYGTSRQRLVTVKTASGTQADALASLVSVMGGDAFPIAEKIVGENDLQIWLWENTPKGWILVEFSSQ